MSGNVSTALESDDIAPPPPRQPAASPARVSPGVSHDRAFLRAPDRSVISGVRDDGRSELPEWGNQKLCQRPEPVQVLRGVAAPDIAQGQDADDAIALTDRRAGAGLASE